MSGAPSLSTAGQKGRRAWLASLVAICAICWLRAVWAQAIDVPLRLQAELLAKVAAYDRGFAARAKGRALVLIVIKAGDAASERVGAQMSAELDVLREIGGLPRSQQLVLHTSAQALGEQVRALAPAIVYISLGFGNEMERIADALDGVSVLSVGASASYVPRRAVLGFDVESGKPKLVVHLAQARRQHVAFKPELLKLARVVQ